MLSKAQGKRTRMAGGGLSESAYFPVSTVRDGTDLSVNLILSEEIGYCLTTGIPGIVVVHDHISAWADAAIEIAQRIHGRTVQVAIKTKDRQVARSGRSGDVSQKYPCRNLTWSSSRLNLSKLALTFSREHFQIFELAEVVAVCIRGWRGKPSKESATQTVRSLTPWTFKTASHEDRRATSPRAGFDKVPWNVVPENILNARLNVVETLTTHHGVAEARPVTSFGPFGWLKRPFPDQEE